MKRNAKRFAALLSALLIAAVPTQTFAASNCNIQSLLGFQVKGTPTSYSNNLLSGGSCGLAKNLGLNNVKGVATKAATANKCTANLSQYFDKAGTSLANLKSSNCFNTVKQLADKSTCGAKDCTNGNDCTGNDCANGSNTCTGNDCTNNDCTGSNCDTGACAGSDCNNGSNTCTGNDCTTGNTGSDAGTPVNNGGNTSTDNNGNTSTDNGSATAASSQAQQVTSLVNEERAAAGLNALTLDSALSKVAQAKAEDMAKNGYFSHTSPTYGSPFDMMKSFGINYSAAGENIAKGQKSAESVMNAWMNSSGHRANILGSSYEKIGVGYTTDAQGNTYWVQMFIK